MQLTLSRRGVSLAACLVASIAGARPAVAEPAPPAGDDVLGTLSVPPGASTRAPPRIAIVTRPEADADTATLREILARDLDLSGELEVLPPLAPRKAPRFGKKAPPDGLDLKDHAARGAETVIRVRVARTGEDVELELEGFLVKDAIAASGADKRGPAWKPKPPPTPSFARAVRAPAVDLRPEGHRFADHVLAVLTGHAGGFASRMAFAGESGGARRVFLIDSDGQGLAPASPPDHVAVAAAFGKRGELYYAASVDRGEYQVFGPGGKAVPLAVGGSVYGLAFPPTRAPSPPRLACATPFVSSRARTSHRSSRLPRSTSPCSPRSAPGGARPSSDRAGWGGGSSSTASPSPRRRSRPRRRRSAITPTA